MPVKIARSTPRPSFGLRGLLVASHISRLASRDAAKSLLSTLVSESSGECRSRATDRRSASKCQGKWPDQTLDQEFGLPEVRGQHLASLLQEGRENANVDAGLGFIWRISD